MLASHNFVQLSLHSVVLVVICIDNLSQTFKQAWVFPRLSLRITRFIHELSRMCFTVQLSMFCAVLFATA